MMAAPSGCPPGTSCGYCWENDVHRPWAFVPIFPLLLGGHTRTAEPSARPRWQRAGPLGEQRQSERHRESRLLEIPWYACVCTCVCMRVRACTCVCPAPTPLNSISVHPPDLLPVCHAGSRPVASLRMPKCPHGRQHDCRKWPGSQAPSGLQKHPFALIYLFFSPILPWLLSWAAKSGQRTEGPTRVT